ncbi:hypothetical protein [Bradyrhizobium macuxiense]|uniref:hypothetical protein n=1 Tax=Bradyrhizobium macuxiense TaxID=1755647 RepID=UPI000A4F04AB|nr:hypothetical protein [Bradyrhizobium macuxiense]
MSERKFLERSRRGNRYCAFQGQLSVFSGALFVYRYKRKTDHFAYYEVDELQAGIVRRVDELYIEKSTASTLLRA